MFNSVFVLDFIRIHCADWVSHFFSDIIYARYMDCGALSLVQTVDRLEKRRGLFLPRSRELLIYSLRGAAASWEYKMGHSGVGS